MQKMFLVIIFTLFLFMIGCVSENKKKLQEFTDESLTINEYYVKLFTDSVYDGKNVYAVDDYSRVILHTWIMEGLDYDIEKVSSMVQLDNFDIGDLVVNNGNYQIYNKIYMLISKHFFRMNMKEGFIALGDNYGFYIKTTPQVIEKKSSLNSYLNFTPHKYFESTVILFKFNATPKYNSESGELIIEELYSCLGMYIFHTTTEDDEIKYYPNSNISYSSGTTILFDDVSSKGYGKVEYNISYTIKSDTEVKNINSKYSFSDCKVNDFSQMKSLKINKSDNMEIAYKVEVNIEDSYDVKNNNKLSFIHNSSKTIKAGE